MIHIAAAPPAATPEIDVSGLMASIESFFTGVLTLDPEQAALRGGLTLLVVIGAMLLIWGLRVIYKALTERVAHEDVKTDPTHKSRPLGRWALRIARLAIVVAALI
ncbi:MAG TPA: hypothetical protein PLS69_13375, partial [Terricaulis sp.]|nr:hypothetical protein [Terricaulis sp.]